MQTASEDIVCYKLIQIYHLPDGDDYRSYFQHAKIELDKPIVAGWVCATQVLDGSRILSGEVVHAYRDVYCDDSDIDWYIEDTVKFPFFSECEVSIAKVKCIIPKGTLFCKGIDDDDNICYGALAIIPKQIVQTIHPYEILNSQT